MEYYTSNFKSKAINTYIKKIENLNLRNLEEKIKEQGKEKQGKLNNKDQRGKK